jgi:ADP-heptose:LPS heptosyltransferase
MCDRCYTPLGDFKFAPKPEWLEEADKLIASLHPSKPIMLYRPLVNNHGRRSVSSRNPDHSAYSQIFQSIRDRFHVISVCSGVGEAIVHCDHADTFFNSGQISLELLTALIARANLVYTSAGMALVAASAIGTPVLAVHGGYEGSLNYRDTTVYGPSLLIDCANQCYCMSDNHPCDKSIDIPQAIDMAKTFVELTWKSP